MCMSLCYPFFFRRKKMPKGGGKGGAKGAGAGNKKGDAAAAGEGSSKGAAKGGNAVKVRPPPAAQLPR